MPRIKVIPIPLAIVVYKITFKSIHLCFPFAVIIIKSIYSGSLSALDVFNGI